MEIQLGTLKESGEELAGFLEPRLGAKPLFSGDKISVEEGSVRQGVRPRHVKTYIKRFLHSKGLRKKYRVLVQGKQLTIQELEMEAEEKEAPSPVEEKVEQAEEKKPAPKKRAAKKKEKSEG